MRPRPAKEELDIRKEEGRVSEFELEGYSV